MVDWALKINYQSTLKNVSTTKPNITFKHKTTQAERSAT